MPSFMDELKSKRNEDAHSADMEQRILSCKDAILDRIVQCLAEASVEKIKKDLLSTKPTDPSGNYYEVRYFYPGSIGEVDLDTLTQIFKEFGFDVDYQYMRKIFGKWHVWFNLDDDYFEPIPIGEFYHKKNHTFSRDRFHLDIYGIKYAEYLTKAAKLEGIDISYNRSFDDLVHQDVYRSVKLSRKELEKGTFILASVRVE